MATFEDLRQAEEIDLEEKKKTKFLTQGWKMMQEAEEQKLAAEERKLAADAEEQKLAAEVVECEVERKQAGDGKVAIRKERS